MGRKKITSHEKSNGKKAATAASKHSRDDSDSYVEEMSTPEHVSGVEHDHSSISKAKRRSQIQGCSIMNSDDEVSPGVANSNSSSVMSVSHLELTEVVAKVDYGDDMFFAELEKLHDHYYNWRRDHPGEPIVNDSPMYINWSASKYPQMLKYHFDQESYCMSNNIYFSMKDVGNHQCPIH